MARKGNINPQEAHKGREAIPCGRFSSLSQEGGDSKARQAKSAERVIERWGLVRSPRWDIFDHGKSAFKGEHIGKNGQLGKFLTALDRGEVKPDAEGRMPVLVYERV